MFKDNSSFRGSFFGNYVYNSIIPKSHPLSKLRQIASFNELDDELAHLYSKNGQRAHSPSMMMRISILQYLYNLSDTRIMEFVKYNLAAKYYVGLSVDQDVPDASDLTYFRQRLGPDYAQQIFQRTLHIAASHGLNIGEIALIDSTHTNAKIRALTQRNPATTDDHNDHDADFGKKNKDHLFHGYKNHIAVESNNNLITAVTTTPGNIHDTQEFIPLMEQLEETAPPKIVSADKAYDSQENHDHLEQQDIFSAIIMKGNRFQTKAGELKYERHPSLENSHLRRYLDYRYDQGRNERYRVEQVFAEAKRYHGLSRSRYLGLENNLLQTFLTATVINLKHIVRAIYPELHFYKVH